MSKKCQEKCNYSDSQKLFIVFAFKDKLNRIARYEKKAQTLMKGDIDTSLHIKIYLVIVITMHCI